MRKKLDSTFFNRKPQIVARDLLGKYIVRRIGGKEIALMITETEAYDGQHDLACHARSGKTLRNAPMFAKPSTIYVYFTYGMHWMLNLVCREEHYPAAALIRGAGAISGPARLTKALGIDKRLNTMILGKASGLWVEDRGARIPARAIKRTSRIGVDYAGAWALKPWRFVLKTHSAD